MKMVATGMAHPDLVSTVADRLVRLDRQLTEDQQEEIKQAAGGAGLKGLTASLLTSIDPDKVAERAVQKFGLAASAEPTEEQASQAEQELMGEALKPFHNPKLRELVLNLRRSLEQVIDEQSRDQLLQAGFDAQALEKAQSLVASFRRFIADNREELEALKLLYSQPYRSGLRYQHVKELAAAIERPPLAAPLPRLWHAFEAVEPEKVKGHGGNKLVDVIALVRHAIDPATTLEPFPATVEGRYQAWISEQEAAGVNFTLEQRRWLDAIRDHIANSLSMDQDDFDYAPFNVMGGLGEAYAQFGDRLTGILAELNERLAA